jgi:hypothetical protein
MSASPTPIAVDERACAAALGMSVAWLRKDRLGSRLLPHFKLGSSVRYNLDRCREALNAAEVGGLKAAR